MWTISLMMKWGSGASIATTADTSRKATTVVQPSA